MRPTPSTDSGSSGERGLGFSRPDIRDILGAPDAGCVPCDHVAAAVDRRLRAIADQLERLHALRAELLALRSRLKDTTVAGTSLAGRPCPCLADDDASLRSPLAVTSPLGTWA